MTVSIAHALCWIKEGMFNYHRKHYSHAQKWPEASVCWNIQQSRLHFGLHFNLLSSLLVKWFYLQMDSKSFKAGKQLCRIGGAGFQILSVLTSKLWPNFTWQNAVFCLIQKIALLAEEAVSRGMQCDDNEGNWGTEGGGWWIPRARLECAACVVEQMGLHTAQPSVPCSSSAVPVFRAAGAGGEHLEFLCLCCRVFVWLSVELFSSPPGLLWSSCAFLRWPSFKD